MSESSGRRWARIFKPDVRLEVNDELAFHLEQRVRDNIARGMTPDAARVAAEQRLGDLESVQSECIDLLKAERRAEARREWLRFSWLDFKLGFRMLAKYPGLTVVGGIAIAFAMAIGAFAFEFMMQVVRPSLPLPGGDRIVAVRLWDRVENEPEARALHDFTVWRAESKAIEELGIFRDRELNLIGPDGVGRPVATAEITASGFRLARVAPMLGRTLIDDDQRAGASAVIVLGERAWRDHFAADPTIIGRVVRLNGEQRTVVGVMPQWFAFPLYHSAWIPFQLKPAYEPLQGPGIGVFGRLAPDATMEQAQAELTALGVRAAKDSPASHEHLRPQVLPFTDSVFDREPIIASYFINSFVAMFLVLIYANVALLMFGRAVTRENEIVVRNALGASRSRILTQLFTEALVLGAVGAIIGLIVARFGVSWAFSFISVEVDLPFWYHEQLSLLTMLYAVGLTLLAALIAGVIPALKVTRGIGTQLRAASAGGGGLGFGRAWTGVIIAQVAFTVAFFPILISVGDLAWRASKVDLGFPAEKYLALRLERASEAETTNSRGRAAMYQDLKRRVSAEPGVTAVTYASQLPGVYHDRPAIEVEGVSTLLPSGVRPRAQRATVDLDFFRALNAPIQAGRGFHSADLRSDARVVVVNESFGRVVLGGRNPIAHRLRYVSEEETDDGRVIERAGPWHEVIGVVKDLAMWVSPDLLDQAGVYHLLMLEGAAPIRMAVRVEGDPASFAPRLHSIASAVDPGAVATIEPLADLARGYWNAIMFWFRILVVAGGVALLLALAGIYSVMSFTVSRRTREIGIRVALGSTPRRIVASMFSRGILHVGCGVLLGAAVWILFDSGDADPVTAKDAALVTAYAALMMLVCTLACIVPARRALRVQPTDALKAEA